MATTMASSEPSLPKTHRSLSVQAEPKDLVIVDKPLPKLEDDEILVRVVAVTLNPADHKQVWGWGVLNGGESNGCDFAGDVVWVGRNAHGKGVEVGDAVCGLVRGGIPNRDNGSFQEYLKTWPEIVWKFPKSVLSYEHAAALGGISGSTAAQALYNRLPLPPPWAPAAEPIQIVIWGGATSVGIYCIRLARLSGLRVATTASPKNHALMKELGAELVLDYRDPETPKKIKEWGKGNLVYAVDNVSEKGSTRLTAQCLSDDGGSIVLLLPVSKDEVPANVKLVDEFIFNVVDRNEEVDMAFQSRWYKRASEFAADLNVMPLKIWPGGFEALPAAIDYLKAGKASGEKVAVRIG